MVIISIFLSKGQMTVWWCEMNTTIIWLILWPQICRFVLFSPFSISLRVKKLLKWDTSLGIWWRTKRSKKATFYQRPRGCVPQSGFSEVLISWNWDHLNKVTHWLEFLCLLQPWQVWGVVDTPFISLISFNSGNKQQKGQGAFMMTCFRIIISIHIISFIISD